MSVTVKLDPEIICPCFSSSLQNDFGFLKLGSSCLIFAIYLKNLSLKTLYHKGDNGIIPERQSRY